MVQGRTILLVDRDEDSLAVYSALLQHRGYRVLVARSADEGVKVAETVPPQVIITELFRRTERGWDTLEALRADPGTRRIPIVVLTARVLEDDRARALASGCDAFLMKPFPPGDLAAVIEGLLPVGGALMRREA